MSVHLPFTFLRIFLLWTISIILEIVDIVAPPSECYWKPEMATSQYHTINSLLSAEFTRRMAIANGTCISFCNQPKAPISLGRDLTTTCIDLGRGEGLMFWWKMSSATLSLRPCHASTTLVHASAATGAIPLRSYRVQHHVLTATNKITSRCYYDQ